MSYGVIGDTHLAFKAYDSNRRTEECTEIFEQTVKLLYDAGIRTIFQVGDLIDDTVWPNWVEKQANAVFKKYSDVEFIILGGNHDSTKTYSSVSALDVLEERPNMIIVNSHTPEVIQVAGLKVLCIPHMKSQREFKQAIESITGEYDMGMLHAMVYSNLDLGPNDLNIDEQMMDKLMKHCRRIYIGHQHCPVIVNDKVTITGSTMELNFGELGPRYAYIVDQGVQELIPIPQPRLMKRIDINWAGVNDLLDKLHNLSIDTIYKVVVMNLPPSEYSACQAAIESVNFIGDLIYDLIKIGHEEVEINTIDASFDLVTEFKLFCEDNNYDYALVDSLQDAVALLLSEEEDSLL